jgi:predicted nucleotidyltransferase
MAEGSFEPERILRTLVDHRVEFVLIGGLAAVVHGADYVTTDADICPADDRRNLNRLSEALRALNAHIRVEGIPDGLPFDHDGASLGKARIWNLTTDAGDLDVSFVPSGTKGHRDLVTNAVVIKMWGAAIQVADLADVVRSKRAAGRPKDRLALPVLERLLAERHEV